MSSENIFLFSSLYETMKKIIYLFLLIAFTFLAGCKGGGSVVDPEDPEEPLVPENLKESDLIGIWETYYYEKQISTGGSYFSGLRYIDYDGFKTEFKKEGDKYVAKDYNLANNLIFEAEYSVKGDTIKFSRLIKTEDGRDSTDVTWQRIRQFSPEKGFIKLDQSYPGMTQNDNTQYKITDIKIARNIKTAPTTIEGVSKGKYMVDFDDFCKGRWQFYLFREYEGGRLKEKYSEEMTTLFQTTSLKFFVNNNSERKCTWREWNPKQNKWYETEYPVIVIDDVIHLLDKEQAVDDDGNAIFDEDGEPVMEDISIYLWVTDWKEREGTDSFIDLKESRYAENLKEIVKTQIYLKRVFD